MKSTLHEKVFSYELAFGRNMGWISPKEQEKLKHSCVAVAGLGGAGGLVATTLARLGVGNFKLADPESFDMTDINRQTGASWDTLFSKKTEVISQVILGINPEARVETFPEGINEENINLFLKGMNLAIDGIDLFKPRVKLLFFKACREKKIPVITSCPLGFGASLLVFSPEQMSWEDYLGIFPEMDDDELILRSLFGLSPSAFALTYAGSGVLNLEDFKGSTVAPALTLVASLAATEAVKVLTDKGSVRSAPHIYEIDMMKQCAKHRHFQFGMNGPIMRLRRVILINFLKRRIGTYDT